MDFVNRLLADETYRELMERNEEAERNRIFCKHGFSHLFDVARIAYCMALEQELPIDKETIYLCALLHDIAKWKQYADGTDHATEGGRLAGIIMERIGLEEDRAHMIAKAIETHRSQNAATTMLGRLLYDADKTSRLCFACKSRDACKTHGKPHPHGYY